MIPSETPYNALSLLPPDRDKVETIAVLRQVSKAAAAMGELKGLARTLPNPNILLNALILREASASSEIENIITTQDRLYQALTLRNLPNDSATKEVLRYREALLTGFHSLTSRGFINTNAIIQIQQVLEENSAGIRRLPGTALKNAATGATIYTPPDQYEIILALMQNLEQYLHDEDDISPYIKLAVQHYQFESIHPFYDGNGRTGRILNVLFLIFKGCLDQPILYHSKYIIDNKSDYYRLLQEVRTKDNWEEWVLFMVKGVEQTANETVFKIHKINNLFEYTVEKIKKEKPKVYSKELVELLFVQPYCRIETIVDQLAVTRPTASRYLNELVTTGMLRRQQIWKETLFIHEALVDLLKV
ncbi:MAG: Fic family protein [Lewinellaceae bacterium]|nr:Fic family protein [Lewinellaceae bacterium]